MEHFLLYPVHLSASFPVLGKDRAQDVRNWSHDYLTQPVGHILRTETGTRGYYESGITEPTSS